MNSPAGLCLRQLLRRYLLMLGALLLGLPVIAGLSDGSVENNQV